MAVYLDGEQIYFNDNSQTYNNFEIQTNALPFGRHVIDVFNTIGCCETGSGSGWSYKRGQSQSLPITITNLLQECRPIPSPSKKKQKKKIHSIYSI